MEQLLQQIEQYRQEIAAIVPNGAESLAAYRATTEAPPFPLVELARVDL